MSSRLVYFSNVISRTEALAKANVIREPKWLKACLKFPPLSEPVNPVLPDWENTEQTKTHRVGNMTRLDGHRYSFILKHLFPCTIRLCGYIMVLTFLF